MDNCPDALSFSIDDVPIQNDDNLYRSGYRGSGIGRRPVIYISASGNLTVVILSPALSPVIYTSTSRRHTGAAVYQNTGWATG